MICIIRVIPSRNPMFHKNEIDDGEGRSISELLRIFPIGWFFISWVFIRMMIEELGLGSTHELKCTPWLRLELSL